MALRRSYGMNFFNLWNLIGYAMSGVHIRDIRPITPVRCRQRNRMSPLTPHRIMCQNECHTISTDTTAPANACR